MIDEKIDKLYQLLDILEYDPETKTLTIDSDIKIVVRGEYRVDCDKHMKLNSGYMEYDNHLKIPYSIFCNSEETEFKKIQDTANSILSEYDDFIDEVQGDCGCNQN